MASSLNKKRGLIKSQLTRFETYYKKVADEESADIVQLEQRLNKAEPLLDEYNNIQYELELNLKDDDQEGLDALREESESFEDSYYNILSDARKYIMSKTAPIESISPSGSSSYQQSSTTQANIKLPPLNLPTFDGSYNEWLFFKDTFRSVIHENTTLSKVQKFHYLRLSLKGDAANIIKSLEISNGNYDSAWTCVIERYENKQLLVSNHIKALFNLPSVTKESCTSLRQLLDGINRHLRALKSLELPTEHWDTLIIYLVATKLDPTSRREWETKNTKKSELPTLKSLIEFLSERCCLLETLSNEKTTVPNHTKSVKAFVGTNQMKCVICDDNHTFYNCQKFLNLDPNGRFEEVKRLRLCVNCLRKNHTTKQCTSSKCRKCGNLHNTLLHFTNKNNAVSNSTENIQCSFASENNNSSPHTSLCSTQNKKHTLLSTAVVEVIDNNGQAHTCRALLDSGSESNYITKQLCEKLKLKTNKCKILVTGINQISSSLDTKTFVNVQSRLNSFKASLSCFVIDKITGNIPSTSFNSILVNIPPNLILADPNFSVSDSIDMLIGNELFYDLLCTGQIKLGQKLPTLQKTLFGWIISGPLFFKNSTSYETHCNLSRIEKNDLSEQIERFWKIEELPPKQLLSAEEHFCEEHFKINTIRDPTGRFVVSLPFKEPTSKLGDSLKTAEKRFYCLEQKLEKNENLKIQYVDFMNQYIALGHMSRLNSISNDGFYLPHHCVLKDSSTTKLRVVFDGSAKTSSGFSLNNILAVGPNIQDDLIAIVLRFRIHNIILVGDIEKMYRQVLVKKEERIFQKILWRADPSEPLTAYELNTVTYGTAPASFLSVRALHEIAKGIKDEQSDISSIIIHDFYVDDLLTGGSTSDEVLHIKNQISQVLAKHGFSLRKWVSNDSQVLCQSDNQNPINIGNNDRTKTLGLFWNPVSDTLSYFIKNEIDTSEVITKRTILSYTAQLFDPLGLLSPIIIVAKILIQRLWGLQISWDESVPLNIHTAWYSFRTELRKLNDLQIPRRSISRQLKHIELHGFADASQTAYGACVYLKSSDMQCRLLCAKTRVAPLKSVTIPRLELCAALLLAELIERVKVALSPTNIKLENITYWSDSTIALTWIKGSPHTWKVFVSNRVARIQELTNPSEWNYVNTNDNPADLLSRGISVDQLMISKQWWSGPDWLSRSSDEWPDKLRFSTLPHEIPEVRAITLTTTKIDLTKFKDFPELNKFSTMNKTKRVFAYVLRFINNIKTKNFKQTGTLSPDELNYSLMKLVHLVQAQTFPVDIKQLKISGHVNSKSPLINLNPFLDEHNVIRVGGRLKHSNFNFNKKFPAVLPKSHSLSILITRDEHVRLLHSGPQALLASLRDRFWPISGRDLARKVVHECIKCYRFTAHDIKNIMGDLPQERLTSSRPFEVTGVDYCGPFLVKEKMHRNTKFIKSYICIFICFATKAMHLEVVSDLSTESFIASLRRFVGRRGLCQKIVSDNGSTFVGAKAQLKKFLEDSGETVQTKLAQDGIAWSFIPPRAPHFGGLWEAGVKSVKYHLKRIVGETSVTFEELTTLAIQIEACLNSRPLYPLSSDPNDPSPLTPAHFLIGSKLTAVPDNNWLVTPNNHLSRFEHIQKMTQHFWSRWAKEYISNLQVRTKWKENHPQLLKIGTIVLVKEDGLPPLKWLLGRVIKLFPGSDGVVRTATLKTVNGTYQRPTTTQAAPSIEACPPDSVVSEDACKCDPASCRKPPCLAELVVATNGSDLPGQCCPTYSCVGCANETMIDGKCTCATEAVIVGHKCVCVDLEKSLVDGECVCNPLQCPMPPVCDKKSVAVVASEDCCKKTVCIPCPSDSESTNLEGGELEDHCVCLPCKTDCGNNKTVIIKKHGSGFPGNCCDLYECQKPEEINGCFNGEEFYENGKEWLTPDSQVCKCYNGLSLCSKPKEKEAQSCFMDNKLYHNYESWTREDGCTECVCKAGVEQCISHFCDVKESHIQKNHSCFKNDHIYQHTESWTDVDGCTKCTCINGDESCSDNLCEQTTLKPDDCQPLSNCNKTCMNGFKINKKGCEICKCNIVRLGQDILSKYNISLNELIKVLDDYKNRRTSTPSTTTSTSSTTTTKSVIEVISTTRPVVVINRGNFLEDVSSTTPEPVVVPADAGREPWVYIAIPVLAGGIFIFVIAIMCVYKSKRNSSIDLTHCHYQTVNNNNTIKKTEPLL